MRIFSAMFEPSSLLPIPLLRQKGVDWIQLAQDRNQQQAIVNTVMNFQFP
jgi:hypothetical protein